MSDNLQRFLESNFVQEDWYAWSPSDLDWNALDRLNDEERANAEEILIPRILHVNKGFHEVVFALAEIGTHKAVEPLKQAREKIRGVLEKHPENPIAQNMYIHFLLAVELALWRTEGNPTSLDYFIDTLKNATNERHRFWAAWALRYCPTEKSVTMLLDTLRDGKADVRHSAMGSLLVLCGVVPNYGYRYHRIEHPLLEKIKSDDATVQLRAVEEIEKIVIEDNLFDFGK
jgi:hypothetical protein